ncbi:hypothetical protein ECWI1_P4746 (plasmid) [Escherichia coli]|uniref:Uncharacterized protein n=4 Tax=Enterobacterales TaxID=91347 RepID=A0A090M1K5_CITFR|nr:hypothetical protein [Citrobacter portucalensis]ACI63150.1 hypothetical protein [Klebsiella pneumoniae]AGP47437.1 hypothetical protein FCF1305_p0019 [Klebsiella pneumoniae FCF1305]AGP47505.1 hypothetical protein FCF3SP_p0027 [Klebsiella pneumoniae FCF3SP]CDK88989.1 hypothetical protein [Escherichia coli IS29]CEF90332.1 hypothetical protein [Citrobacter freundii]CZR15239.1 hypothetical protein [Yersinia pseudotuberculosis]SMB39298.1 hypothetical protein ECWI1_P4746 [Escherichia coli]
MQYTFTQKQKPPAIPGTGYLRLFLGERYFLHLGALKKLNMQGDVRVLFCFVD